MGDFGKGIISFCKGLSDVVVELIIDVKIIDNEIGELLEVDISKEKLNS